jgi:uncharacterized protein YeeX (DUF496 family)
MTNAQARNLAFAITAQAVKDYLREGKTDAQKQAILKELRSPYMQFITDGTSDMVAEQLEKNPKEIAERLNKMQKEDQT